jgi:hypothetical protein
MDHAGRRSDPDGALPTSEKKEIDMHQRRGWIAAAGLLLGLGVPAAWAGAQELDRDRDLDRTGIEGAGVDEEDAIFGRDLMTEDELRTHRDTMRSLRTEEERRAYREAHHARMVERARERGVELPEEPPPVGMGQGRGPGDRPEPGIGRGPGPGPGERVGPKGDR